MTLDFHSGHLVQLPRSAATVIAADPDTARVQPLSATSLFVTVYGPAKTTLVAPADDAALAAQYVRGGPPMPATAAPPDLAKPTAGLAIFWENSENVRQMVANPVHLSIDRGAQLPRGTPAAQAVDRLNADKSKPLPQTGFVIIGKGGGGGGGSPQQ